ELTVTEEPHLENSVELFPNPANDHLVVKLKNEDDEILKIQLFNLAGIKQSIYFFDNTINLSGIIPGYYTLHLELSNGQRIIHKIIKE
ncbi:MAG: T9SS type A sorting domain-containing protein, partial [Flavobacteriales bacterium]|nr:T9SS type A sorting domain-containing protein [Flavobacteriales bacterium]